LLVNGSRVTEAVVRAGDTLTLQNSVVFLVVRRSGMPALGSYPARFAFPFGDADPHGMVGESPVAWALRDALAFAASSAHHVLLHGPSGAGKELAARTIHGISSRSEGSFVARNAATLPEGLVDAELFGNLKNYPNPGMPERRGLVGEADRGSLFLDEVGELPASLQAHLLRVLDRDGEYQRLGEARSSRADFRLIAATNRSPQELKHDLLARFASRIAIPALETRREDIPLLIRHLLERARAATPALARFFAPEGARLDPTLVELLLRHPYTHELRELDRLLWVAASTSPGQYIAATPEVFAELGGQGVAPPAEVLAELGRAEVEQALAAASGSVTRAARALGLKNRFALYRLMKRHGLAAEEEPGDG
jgi:two-component system nitrogen regulation response regulator GlnG/two-component system response regulator HydG